MKEETLDVIEALNNLDLSVYPYDEAKKLISCLGKFACIKITLHPGKTIMRSRP